MTSQIGTITISCICSKPINRAVSVFGDYETAKTDKFSIIDCESCGKQYKVQLFVNLLEQGTEHEQENL